MTVRDRQRREVRRSAGAPRHAHQLTRRDLAEVLSFCNRCLEFSAEAAFHDAIRELAASLGFEFVL